MAPVAVDQITTTKGADITALKAALATATLTDVDPENLRAYAHIESTPHVGTEFIISHDPAVPTLDIQDVLASPAKLKALSTLVSERGVVFFRKAKITPEEQKVLVDALGRAGGKPETSGLHTHPVTLPNSQYGDEITHITNQFVLSDKFSYKDTKRYAEKGFGKTGWHSDITFERVPSDYATLQIRTIPSEGGDTLWASAYEAYDRLSPALQKFLEGLTATHVGDIFLELSAKSSIPLRERRGAPENTDQLLTTTHPVIRTNPVTGWKALFVNNGFTTRINELSKIESDILLAFLFEIVYSNHDLQVRYKWQPDNLAIWDNRSSFHNASGDVPAGELRAGTRSVSLGEVPFFDPNSKSRRADLAEKKAAAASA